MPETTAQAAAAMAAVDAARAVLLLDALRLVNSTLRFVLDEGVALGEPPPQATYQAQRAVQRWVADLERRTARHPDLLRPARPGTGPFR